MLFFRMNYHCKSFFFHGLFVYLLLQTALISCFIGREPLFCNIPRYMSINTQIKKILILNFFETFRYL